jgi:hypothetical protein
MKARPFKRFLTVKLTDDEILERARACALLNKQAEDVEKLKLIAMRDFGEKLKMLHGEARKLSQSVHAGEEGREVECWEEIHGDHVVTFRSDTGEEVQELRRLADGDDKQAPLL